MQELELANGGTQPRAASLVVSDYVKAIILQFCAKRVTAKANVLTKSHHDIESQRKLII